MLGWAVMAIYYSNLPAPFRGIAGLVFGAGALAILLLTRPPSRGKMAFLLIWTAVLVWWLTIPPSNNRQWQRDVALLPYAEINGNTITLHNIRNCDYRSEEDYDVHYYDKTLDLDDLKTVDLFLVYWGSPMIAHTMMSFGFNGNYVCISIETRKEVGEVYSNIKGFFKQYELTYVVADERDVVRLRTNYRHEDVYLFRLKVTPEVARSVFLDYLREINSLKEHPEWYNALTSNCTSNIRGHTKPFNPNASWSWKLIVNGYLDEFAYATGHLNQSLPLPELKKRSYINPTAQGADKDPAFSKIIRANLPGLGP